MRELVFRASMVFLSLALAVEFILVSLRDLQTFFHIENSISSEELIGSIEVFLTKP